jgi:antitoxin (DNA-binding transcriptional repressor) of toxin-antitoxin stability system
MGVMRSVNIGELKAHLSAHIQLVRGGEEVLILDRNKPVARLVPIRAAERSEQEQSLIARGVIVPPLRRRKSSDVLPEPQGNVSDDAMKEIWRLEREGR